MNERHGPVMIDAMRDYERAAEELRAQLQTEPRHWRLFLNLGDIYVKLAQLDRAVDAYQAAARICEGLGENLKACAIYKQIVRVDEGRGHAHVRLTELYDELDVLDPSEEVRLPHVRATLPAKRVLLTVEGSEVLDMVTKHLWAESMAAEIVESPVVGRSYLLLASKVSFEAVRVAMAKLDAAELERAFASQRPP